MYMKFNLFEDAFKVFDEMPDRNQASLNAVISGFSENGLSVEALRLFKEAMFESFRPNSVTIATVLSTCESVEDCMQIHCFGIKLGVELDLYVATSMVTMYSDFGEIVLATRVFGEMNEKTVVSYNALLRALLGNKFPLVVLNVFKDMNNCSDEKPNLVTFITVISACASLVNLQFGRQVHGQILKTELQNDTKVGTSLVDMYSKCGCWQLAYSVFRELNRNRNIMTWNSMIAGMMLNGQIEKGIELFEQLEGCQRLDPDLATWNSMISGFAQLGKEFEALQYFKKMQLAGVLPSLKCVTSVLSACADLSSLNCGKEIHGYATRTGISSDEFMSTSLMDMYMKCGNPSWARKIFDRFVVKPYDPAFWNSMISGYGRNGEYELAIEIFDLMQKEKVKPNSTTFVGILSACSHAGEVDRGLQVFKMMYNDEYGIKPSREHFGCMVDLLGRSGQLEEARELIRGLPQAPASFFHSLLGACRAYLNSDLGEELAMKISEMEPENPTPFIVLSNIFAASGRWEDVERVRQKIDERGLSKLPGSSTGVA